MRQAGDVFATLAERGHVKWDDGQSKEKIFAEPSRLHLGRHFRGNIDVRFGKDLLGPGHVEGQVGAVELHGVARRAQPCSARLRG